MEEIMNEFGYKEGLYANEWRKNNWTVRFSLDKVEAFDSPRMNVPGMYFCKNIKDVDVRELLEDIENYIK